MPSVPLASSAAPASAADVFFHIRDFRGTTPPREGLTVVFEEIHGGGKGPRAMAVQAAGAQSAPSGNRGSEARRARRPEPTRTGHSTGRTATAASTPRTRRKTAPAAPAGAALAYGLMLAWAALVAWAVWTRHLPLWSVAALAGLNLATLWLYAADKNAARRGQWRIAEKQLHLLSVLGGWPAAWLAQQNMRHKSSKTAFRAIYWATIVLNCAALAGFLHWVGAFQPWL